MRVPDPDRGIADKIYFLDFGTDFTTGFTVGFVGFVFFGTAFFDSAFLVTTILVSSPLRRNLLFSKGMIVDDAFIAGWYSGAIIDETQKPSPRFMRYAAINNKFL